MFFPHYLLGVVEQETSSPACADCSSCWHIRVLPYGSLLSILLNVQEISVIVVEADRCFLCRRSVFINSFTALTTTYPDKTSPMFRQLIHRKHGQGTVLVYFHVTHTAGNDCVIICTFLHAEVMTTFTAML